MSDFTTADKIAAYVGGGLVVLGVVVVGLLEMIAGSSHPVTQEGQVVHEALVPLEIRSYIILLGLLIWAVYAIYKVVGTTPATERTGRV
jgi:protein-S-isoprenylcysteine O-methyltransferase Ste14